MATLQEILARAQALREETALGSISPERAGSIMYDTLQQINQMQLEGGSLVISKIYASVSAMEADDAPVSDLTGQALRQGQLVVIVPSDTSSSDLGSVYRYNGTTGGASSWSFTGKIGGYPMDQTPTQGSTRAVTSGGVYEQITQLGQATQDLEEKIQEQERGSLNVVDEDGNVIARFDEDGVKAHRFYVCDENGTILRTIDETGGDAPYIEKLSPDSVLYIADENKNAILGLEKALLSKGGALFVADGADGLLRLADAYPAIHVDYNATQGICEVYVRIGNTNKYVKFNVCHDVDTSDSVYLNIWRIGRTNPSSIVGASFYEYDGTTFSSTGKNALTSLENEFTMEFDGKADHTGGVHGDERIDVDASCYVMFLADGIACDMTSNFSIDCTDFRVVQKSSLHETANSGGSFIAGHPIIAWHTKTTIFGNSGYHSRNFIRMDLQNSANSMTTKSIYSGLTCIHKDAATKVFDESGFLFDATGSGTTYWGTGSDRFNHGKTSYTLMTNSTNGISCIVQSHENGTMEGTLATPNKGEFTSYADRTSDTKYYDYEPNRVLVSGNRISLEIDVKFLIK